MSPPAFLEVRGLHAGYGSIPILHGIDFTIARGEFVGILGHNGMGKTTLLKTLMGLLPASAGEVCLQGRTITRLRPHQRNRAGIGYVPQGRQIFANLSVRENLRMGALAAQGSSDPAEILSEFPRLQTLLQRPGGALSGGEQQLLALARCLAGRPQLILLDEPTEGIQPSIIEEIIATLQRLQQTRGITLLLVEQNLEFLTELSERILLLQKGRISGAIPCAQEAGGQGAQEAGRQALLQEYAGFSGDAVGTPSPSS
jgi:urea ABC transporter ATP-binding protein UrtE